MVNMNKFRYLRIFTLGLHSYINRTFHPVLCAALQRKDWKEVEKQQNKLGLEQFLARRGIGSRKPVDIVRPILKSSK